MAESHDFVNLLAYIEKEEDSLKVLQCSNLKNCFLTGKANTKREETLSGLSITSDAFAMPLSDMPVGAVHASYWIQPCLCMTCQCGPYMHRVFHPLDFLGTTIPDCRHENIEFAVENIKQFVLLQARLIAGTRGYGLRLRASVRDCCEDI